MVRCFLLLAALASFASAADPATAKRDRDAAAVLALEMELAKKPAKLLTYSEAVTAATADGRPLIAYPASVRHPSCPPGAVCAVSEDNQIIIGYPSNGGITIVDRLPPDASDADVLRAFKKAKARGGPVAGEDGKDPFFISLMLPLAIAAPPAPCPGGVCPAPAKPATVPMPMAGPGPVTKGFTVERPRLIRRTGGLVGRFFFPWRR